jgi:polysaccharide deacetylase family protein (PEP-CTERM system associated)
MLNALTIDLEDWGQAVLDHRLPVTDRVVSNVTLLLDFLRDHGVRATFFALGKVCEKHPDLLPAIADAGHEVACHGYSHRRVDRLNPEDFAEDLERSIEIIESQSGRRPLGYRAPQFSIDRSCLWVGPILASRGFRYSSSVFPIRGRRYGVPDWPRFPGRWPNCDLIEFPVTTLRLCGRNWPVCGGGYTRLLPGAVLSGALRRVNRAGRPAVLYQHPYEFATGEVEESCRAGFAVSPQVRFTQSLWRSRVPGRLSALLRKFRFAPMGEVLGITAAADPVPHHTHRSSEQAAPVPIGA